VLKSRFILLATGSEPAFRPDFKPNGERIIAPRLAGALKEMPRSVIIAGGGITGVEYAFAFAALGAKVTLLQRGAQLLRGMDTSLSVAIEHWQQTHLPVQIIKGDAVQTLRQEGDRAIALTASGQSYDADLAFIAAGRQADLTFFDPATLPLHLDNGFAVVNRFAQTNLPGVYAAGDLTGNPMTANRAMMQAQVAVAHMVAGDASKLQQNPIIEAAYTVPGVAQIGDISADAPGHIEMISFTGLLKAQLAAATDGFLKIKTTEPGGKVLGAGAFGPHAAEILAPLQVAMQEGITLEALQKYPFAHPGWGEVVASEGA
jgi:dihydrolipoamide dehydrogenase